MFQKGHTFIIAEIGSNHNQDINRAFELIDIAKEAGADAVKFQSLQLNKLIYKEDITNEDRKLFQQINLNEDWYERLFGYAKKVDIECISSPTYLDAIALLKEYGANYIKIASPQTYGFPALIREVAASGIPTIMSTGYCNDEEIDRAVSLFKKYGDEKKLALLHCVSQYPTDYQNVNLRYMEKMKNRYHLPIGYSDHTLGNTAVYTAVAMGATVIEKHITISREDSGPDHFFAAEPSEFFEMVHQVRLIEMMFGEGLKKLTDFEQEFRESVVMYPYAARNMQEGEIVQESDIDYYRSKAPGKVFPWQVENMLIGEKLKKNVYKDERF